MTSKCCICEQDCIEGIEFLVGPKEEALVCCSCDCEQKYREIQQFKWEKRFPISDEDEDT